jgi:hypothetical protein
LLKKDIERICIQKHKLKSFLGRLQRIADPERMYLGKL